MPTSPVQTDLLNRLNWFELNQSLYRFDHRWIASTDHGFARFVIRRHHCPCPSLDLPTEVPQSFDCYEIQEVSWRGSRVFRNLVPGRSSINSNILIARAKRLKSSSLITLCYRQGMTEVAIPDPLTADCLSIRRSSAKVQADATMKRKTPSELRGEQLKRRTCRTTHDSLDPFPSSDGDCTSKMYSRVNGGPGRANGLKKTELAKTPKYIDTRVDEDTVPSTEQSSGINPNTACNVSPKNLLQSKGGKDGAPNADESSAASAKDSLENTSQKVEKCSQSIFRSVAEISLGSGALSDQTTINMDVALKGLVSRELPPTSQLLADSYGRPSAFPSKNAGNFCAELQIPGCKTPLDFTIKTTLRLVSSSPLSWCHRLSASDQKNGNSLRLTSTPEVLYSKALLSWSYPQSSLPPSVVSALTLSAARGETDFFLKRQQAWEDSFRSLYYMLRKNMCNIFYSENVQFSPLQGIAFSMPLCLSEDAQVTAEDLVELSEIEKSNLGQTRQLDSMSNVDNTSQSLLAFTGNENVRCKEVKRADTVLVSSRGSDVVNGGGFQDSSASICYCVEIKDTLIPPWTVCGVSAAIGSEGKSFDASFVTETTSVGLNAALGSIFSQSKSGEDLPASSTTCSIPEASVVPWLQSAYLRGLKYANGSYRASLSPM
ncbi:hypothetical protein ACLOJK_005667 [Asimina triloba]